MHHFLQFIDRSLLVIWTMLVRDRTLFLCLHSSYFLQIRDRSLLNTVQIWQGNGNKKLAHMHHVLQIRNRFLLVKYKCKIKSGLLFEKKEFMLLISESSNSYVCSPNRNGSDFYPGFYQDFYPGFYPDFYPDFTRILFWLLKTLNQTYIVI